MRAAYERAKPAVDGQGGQPAKVLIELEGAHEIARFCANLLDDQVEFGALGEEALYRLRREIGPDRFDAYFEMLHGKEYAKTRLPFIRRRPEYMRFVRKMDGLPDVEPDGQLIAKAIADPGSIVKRIHTSFGDDRDESVAEWSARAVLAVLTGTQIVRKPVVGVVTSDVL